MAEEDRRQMTYTEWSQKLTLALPGELKIKNIKYFNGKLCHDLNTVYEVMG